MMMRNDLRRIAAMSLLAWMAPAAARAQVVDRETTVTGPRGNSITRDIRTERFGPMVDRQVTIRRPGGTIMRNTEVFAPRGGGGFYGPRPFIGGGGFYGGPAFFGPPVALGIGLPLPAVNLFVGGGPPPPPVTVYNAPVPYALSTAAANGVAAAPSPQPTPAPGQPTVVVDPVAESIGKLGSIHGHTRREGAIALGKYGDARGVLPLVDKLEHDFDREVRMAAAWALAEIGDPRAIVPLETARQFDKRSDVRTVAAKSLDRMPREVPQVAARARDAGAAYGYPSQRRPAADRPASSIVSEPAESAESAAPPQYNPDDMPPPDPTPSSRGSSGAGVPR